MMTGDGKEAESTGIGPATWSPCHRTVPGSRPAFIRNYALPSPFFFIMPVDDEIEPSSPEVMLAFYHRLYPFKSVFKWLNHEHVPTRLFTNREVAYTLQSDVYLRYNSFTSVEEFKKTTCSLNPTRFEIGPVYTARVCCIDQCRSPSLDKCYFSATG